MSIITPYLLFSEFEEHLDHKGWTGKRAWACDWNVRWTVAPRLGDDWPELTDAPGPGGVGSVYMKCVRVHFLPWQSGAAVDELDTTGKGATGATPGHADSPSTCKVVAEYSSRELDEDTVTLRGKVDVLECGLGDVFTPLDGSGATIFNYKTAKLFPYEEFRVTKVFNSATGPKIVADDIKDIVGRINAATFEIVSKFVTTPTTDQKWSFSPGQVLLIGVDEDTWEVQNDAALYADLEPRYRATYIFGVRCGTTVHTATAITWNHIYRPRVFAKRESGHVIHDGAGEETFSGTAGKWGYLTPPLYETADFTKLWGG